MNVNGLLLRVGMATRSRLLLPTVGLLLLSVILAMLWATHSASVAREREATLRMEEEVRGAAATLSYFFYERGNDMRNAADNRQLLTYFENKALGMSEEYGLLASRLAIEEHFTKMLRDRRVNGTPIYATLALADAGGAIIAEGTDGCVFHSPGAPWNSFLPQRDAAAPLFAVDRTANPVCVVLRQPLTLGEQVVGHILARIPLERVLPLLVRSPEPGARVYCVTEDRHLVATISGVFNPALLGTLNEPGQAVSQRLKAPAETGGDSFAVWVPVAQTPLRMLSVAPTRELLGTMSPWLTTGVAALLSALTLGALALAWRSGSAQLVLSARLDEKTRAEETIREKASELEQLLDSLPGDAFFKDAAGRYITGNASLCKLVGLTREELAGRTDHELFPAALADKYVADDARILSGGVERLETEDQVTDGGARRDVLTRRVAVHDAEGAVIGLIGLGYDISEKKRVERELHAAYAEMEQHVEQRTRQLALANNLLQAEIAERKQAHRDVSLVLSAISALLVGVDRHNRVSKWNQTASDTFHLADEQCLGRDFASLPLPWDWERVLEGLARCNAERQPVKITNLWYERANGKDGFLFLGLSPIFDEQGGFEGVLVLGSDITDLKILEAQLAQAQKLESIGQLAAGVAHEINTPTQYVGDTMSFLRDANADLLRVLDLLAAHLDTRKAEAGAEADGSSGADPGMDSGMEALAAAMEDIEYTFLRKEMPVSFARAKEGIERVSNIVRAMRSFSHPGQNEKKGVDLNEALQNTITVSRNEWKFVATMETDLDPNLPRVICLPAEMNQVFLNLVVNAAHAVGDVVRGAHTLGVIRISTALEGDRVRISIADSGCGIPESAREKIFDPFFTTKEVGKGTGQGLTLAYDIVVNKHGGSISFETGEGLGTTFHILLPLGW